MSSLCPIKCHNIFLLIMLLENWQDVVRHAWVTNLSVIFKFLVSVMGGMDLQR